MVVLGGLKMRVRSALIILALPCLILSCGGYDSLGLADKNSAEAKRYEILKALDEGNYDFVISALEADPTYGGVFTAEEGRLNLAAAYVGKAGFDVNGIVNVIIDSTRAKTTDKFSAFVKALATNIGAKGSLYLSKASSKYAEIVSNCSSAVTDIQKDACFYKGIVDAATAATSMSVIVGDINSWFNPIGCQDVNQNRIGDDADVSACAIEYAVNGSCSDPTARAVSIRPVNFNDGTNTYTFQLIKVTITSTGTCSNKSDYRFIDTNNKTVVLTEGFCKTDFTPCTSLDLNKGCYPCPVVDPQTRNVLDVTEAIANTLQSSTKLINNVIPSGTDVSNAVNQYIQDVCRADQVCSLTDIANYVSP